MRGRLRRQRPHHQTLGRTAECALQQVARYLPLRLLFGEGGLIDVRSEALAADEQTFFRHQLHLLQRGGVAVAFTELFVDFPHGRGRQIPEDGEDIEFGGGWQRDRRPAAAWRGHLKQPYYELKRKSTIRIVWNRHSPPATGYD